MNPKPRTRGAFCFQFGIGLDNSSNDDQAGHTGHIEDDDTGLVYMQARYYDPVIGRFYSNDPIGAMGHLDRRNGFQGFNRYTYAINNPYKYTDPDGEAWSWAAAGVGAEVGAIGGAAGWFVAGAAVGAFTGDPTAAMAVIAVAGATAGGIAEGTIEALAETIVEADLSQPQFQGRYPVEQINTGNDVEATSEQTESVQEEPETDE